MTEQTRRWELPLIAHPQLDFEASVGAISIVPTEPGEAPYLMADDPGGAELRVEITEDELYTRVRVQVAPEPTRLFRPRPKLCRMTLHVPPGLHGSVHIKEGTLLARNLSDCQLNLVTDSGTITAVKLAGKLRFHSGGGRLMGLELAGQLDLHTKAGAVRVSILRLDPGTHQIHTNLGAISAELAHDLPVRINAHTKLGAVQLGMRSVDSAPAVLELSSLVGAIQVKASQPLGGAAVAPPESTPAADSSPLAVPIDDSELERVLSLVEAGKLTAREAAELISAFAS